MKKGDIILNKFGGLRENRILCYIGNGNFVYYCADGWHKGRWNMKDKYHDGTPNLEVIGHSNAFKVLKEDILKYQKTQKECKTFLEDEPINYCECEKDNTLEDMANFIEEIYENAIQEPSLEEELEKEKRIEEESLKTITNLQEENERLHIELEDKAYEQLKEQCFNYKSRIDKAIEYIENKVGTEIHDMMYVIDVSDVLDILKGSDKE